ncbi:hypothetical protein RM533_07530 [Croceicoccus sp. F390]|uniref:Uncharacterized protein n=1 Tax=Croceicoccus esteveae TaxID=3075597 RepID=A0ABU2ZIJ0_9SPHN|nr:hypothetical protein [Croceicoccus sp. F390]MDT0576036.1 hypothetical protein [Croceicoccus sp. F390]
MAAGGATQGNLVGVVRNQDHRMSIGHEMIVRKAADLLVFCVPWPSFIGRKPELVIGLLLKPGASSGTSV